MDDFGRTTTKKGKLTENQKGWLTFAAIALIGGLGAFYLLFFGDAQEGVANELAAEIKALEGEGYGKKVNKFIINEFDSYGIEDKSAKTELQQMLDNMQYKADFSPVKEFSDGQFGGVKIDTATVSSQISQEQYTDVVIKKTISEPNRYLFEMDTESRQLTGGQDGSAWLVTNYDDANGFVEFNAAKEGIKAFDIAAKKASFKDGSGSLEYASLNDFAASFLQNESDSDSSFEAKLAIGKINPGQMLKFLIGDVKPVQIDFDMDYDGDHIRKIATIAEQTPDLIAYIDQGAGELAKQASAADKFSGDFRLNNFSILTEGMGFETNADLKFEGFPYQPIPVGELKLSVKSLEQLIAYLSNFIPIPQEEVNAQLQQMNNYFTKSGDDFIFSATFDGSRNVKLGNGKVIDLVASLKRPEPAKFSAPEQNSGFASELENSVNSNAQPIEIPTVETKPLQ